MSVTIKYLKSPQNLLEPGLTVRIFYISLLHVTEYRSEKNKTKKNKKKTLRVKCTWQIKYYGN